jgi:hypothetical protein
MLATTRRNIQKPVSPPDRITAATTVFLCVPARNSRLQDAVINWQGQNKDSVIPPDNHHGDTKSMDKKSRILISVEVRLSSVEKGTDGTPVPEERNNGND